MGDNVNYIITVINNEITGLLNWLSGNNLILNVKKTKYIIVNMIPTLSNLSVKFNNKYIERLSSVFE